MFLTLVCDLAAVSSGAYVVPSREFAMSDSGRWPGAPRIVYPPDVGGDAAFRALVAQGYLHELWTNHAVAADVPVTAAIRAGGLAGALTPAERRCVVGRATAVWLHTGAHRPRRADLLVPPGVRIPPPDVGHVAHETRLDPDECVDLGPLRVTDVCRTAADVARWLPLSAAAPMLATLADHPLFDAGRAAAALARLHRHRGVRQAVTLLEAMAPARAQLGSPTIPALRDPVMR